MALLLGTLIGGQGGYSFSYYGGTDGRVVQKIKVWAATSRIKAIDIWLTDGVQKTFGDPSKPAGEGDLRTAEFTFNSNESVTQLSLWGNGAGTRSGWIYFKTNQNRVFDFGMYSWGKQQEYPQNVASGIWAGIRGRASSDIDSLGVVFLQPIATCTLVNASYPTLEFSGSGTATTVMPIESGQKSLSLLNTTTEKDEKLAYKASITVPSVDISNSWTISNPTAGLLQLTGTSFITVQARHPQISYSSTGQAGWMITSSDQIYPSLSSSTSLSVFPWNASNFLESSKSVTCSVSLYKGTVSGLSFNGSLLFSTSNGYSFSISCDGKYSGITMQYIFM